MLHVFMSLGFLHHLSWRILIFLSLDSNANEGEIWNCFWNRFSLGSWKWESSPWFLRRCRWGIEHVSSNRHQPGGKNRRTKLFSLFSSWFESIHRSKRRLGRAGKVCSVNNRLKKEKKKKETLKRCCKTLVRNSQMTLISRYCIRSCCMMRVRVVERD